MNRNLFFNKTLLLFLTLILSLSISSQSYRKVTFRQIKAEGKVWGIDMSHHQNKIDWDKFKHQKPHFIFFKATEGISHKDTKYSLYYKRAREMKIVVGSYHFFSYRSSGKAQANYFLSVAKFKKGDLPPVLDAEFRRNMPADTKVTKELLDFIKVINAKTGVKPIIYCDYKYYEKYLKNKLKTKHDLWICNYRKKPQGDWMFWQTTDKFKIAGIKGYVDFNLFNGNKEKLNGLLIK
ncbi:MAG: GH25 family lysozyme [Paludibacter sp.]|nr:GH25 family lysozyme [Paludibacter sp.]